METSEVIARANTSAFDLQLASISQGAFALQSPDRQIGDPRPMVGFCASA
jgi:hypothetical protein